MREDYDSFKVRIDPLGKDDRMKYFLCVKTVEDGVRHPRWRGSDRSIRTLINTVYTRTYDSRLDSFISEDLRYDLDWLLERIVDYTKFDVSLDHKEIKAVGEID